MKVLAKKIYNECLTRALSRRRQLISKANEMTTASHIHGSTLQLQLRAGLPLPVRLRLLPRLPLLLPMQ